ncbi:bifunctional DNA primase/polymerase [Streptomyces sp. NBC_01481]|uniref:bifunctional DNA primase/polymerase n=1 Tax=Streptomyces sp. NBC_01481 TaxID=2975869 RepID=UPI0022532EDD|nr:bifunctional DNA primase/polymerase [Streptomyces sp. NBC_01481]MCX4587060.1 bifunctional DNA primase/polymerase [Streptomyces sp. NBC_01481]
MPQPERSALHQAAQDVAARGWHVFPLIPGDKRPAIRDWAERATTDPERIARCWAHAPYNIGIATGPSRLVVVDLDMPKTPDDTPPADWAAHGVANGADVLKVLCDQHGQPYPSTTYTVRTWSGGTHLYFAAPEGEELRNTTGDSSTGLGWKVDTRAVGGLVVAAGSSFGGRPYTVVDEAPVQPLPGWLLELLRPAPLPPQKPVMVTLASDRCGKWLRAAINGELERVTRAQEGERNTALYIAAVALGQLVAGGALGEAEVTEWLTAAALQTGQSEREARRTIASGLRAGAKRPRTVAA